MNQNFLNGLVEHIEGVVVAECIEDELFEAMENGDW